jgi:hypothetical protein
MSLRPAAGDMADQRLQWARRPFKLLCVMVLFSCGPKGGLQTTARSVAVRLEVRGDGRVSAAGASCTGSCVLEFPRGSQPLLSAQPSDGWYFAGWRQACSSPTRRDCKLASLYVPTTLQAKFLPVPMSQAWLVVGGDGLQAVVSAAQEGQRLLLGGVYQGELVFQGGKAVSSDALGTVAISFARGDAAANWIVPLISTTAVKASDIVASSDGGVYVVGHADQGAPISSLGPERSGDVFVVRLSKGGSVDWYAQSSLNTHRIYPIRSTAKQITLLAEQPNGLDLVSVREDRVEHLSHLALQPGETVRSVRKSPDNGFVVVQRQRGSAHTQLGQFDSAGNRTESFSVKCHGQCDRADLAVTDDGYLVVAEVSAGSRIGNCPSLRKEGIVIAHFARNGQCTWVENGPDGARLLDIARVDIERTAILVKTPRQLLLVVSDLEGVLWNLSLASGDTQVTRLIGNLSGCLLLVGSFKGLMRAGNEDFSTDSRMDGFASRLCLKRESF